VVNAIMYLPAPDRVVALDPQTGKEIWRHPVIGGPPSRRGVGYSPGDASHAPRIIFTSGRRLFALNAETGAPEAGFGRNGEVDMVVPYNSVPFIHKNVIVVGANTPAGPVGAPGNARAFDARTGASCGNSAPCRSRARSATTRGRVTAGKGALASMRGPSTSRWTSSGSSCTSPWHRPQPVFLRG